MNDILYVGRGTPIYIQQDDILFSQLTTYETLETSFLLSDGNDVNSVTNTTSSLISRMINDLGLKKVRRLLSWSRDIFNCSSAFCMASVSSAAAS